MYLKPAVQLDAPFVVVAWARERTHQRPRGRVRLTRAAR